MIVKYIDDYIIHEINSPTPSVHCLKFNPGRVIVSEGCNAEKQTGRLLSQFVLLLPCRDGLSIYSLSCAYPAHILLRSEYLPTSAGGVDMRGELRCPGWERQK